MTKSQLLGLAIYFLGLEERAKRDGREPLARWARRMYERYRDRLDRVRAGEPDATARSYRPAR
jgi:hypothetical protein